MSAFDDLSLSTFDLGPTQAGADIVDPAQNPYGVRPADSVPVLPSVPGTLYGPATYTPNAPLVTPPGYVPDPNFVDPFTASAKADAAYAASRAEADSANADLATATANANAAKAALAAARANQPIPWTTVVLIAVGVIAIAIIAKK